MKLEGGFSLKEIAKHVLSPWVLAVITHVAIDSDVDTSYYRILRQFL